MILKNNELLHLISLIEKEESSIKGIEQVNFKKGQPFVIANKYLKHIYVIKSGVCKCVINEENNRNYLVEFLGNGEIIGEIEAIIGCKTITTVLAITDMVVYKIELGFFNDILLPNKKFTALLLKELANRLRNTAIRSSFQQLNTVEISLSKILSLQEEHKLTFNKKDLSEYLGISIRSLNRELVKLNLKIEQNRFK